jgi:phenylacetic acid degradation operon negative regulatory protein
MPPTTHALAQRIDQFRQLGRMQAGSLITSVFGDAVLPRGGRLWLGSLIALLEPLGLNERLVRTAVYRLVKEGWLATEAHGRRTDYMLTPDGQSRFLEASRQIYAAETPPWDGQWRLLLVVAPLDNRSREALRRALFWQGFGEWGTGAFVHPSADLASVFKALRNDGMAPLLPALLPLLASQPPLLPSGQPTDLVRNAWNLDELAQGYAVFVDTYRPVLQALEATPAGALDPAQAFQLRTLLIHDFRRLLLRDPELPDELLAKRWPGQQARALSKAMYGHLLAPSEAYLDGMVHLASRERPPVLPGVQARFGGNSAAA